MFASAFKSISSTINSNYTVASAPTSTAGPWKIYDAKKKSTGKAYSVFVFDRKALDAHASSLGRSGAGSFKRAADEVVERLRKEASSLARLRHPSVLELVEPVEDTRGGGLQFATEAVTASLASLLQDKDDQERAGGVGGRSSRYVAEGPDGSRRRRELEIDELEIQKGLLQLGKALEFLHENAGLVHGNVTPDAVLVNAKSDWKIGGLAFCGPAEVGATGPSAAFAPVSVGEILNMDTRLPRSVQLNLDYASPDLVMDSNLTPAADMFALGLLCIALYNAPHRSPIEAHGSVSAYKRAFAAAGAVPSTTNNFLSSRPLPRELATHVLPRLITRRPAQRLSAKEFQTSEYFDNILVSTIRFLDAFPAKTHGEKTSFLRGLSKVLASFPKSVMEKKVLPALLDELKDRALAPLILQNVFRLVELLPSAKRVFGERVLPALKAHFVAGKASAERDAARDASLMVVLERLATVTDNTNGREFKDDVLPIVAVALESPTPSVVNAALQSIPAMLPVLDFSTIKNELFPVVAAIFSKTSSMAIKIRGLQAFVVLCGGRSDSSDGLDGRSAQKGTSSALDKYTMQEKIVPLIKAIKTKEPAVMMEALNVLRVVGGVADADFVALEVLPVLWTMSLGPLLNLSQFQAFMALIKTLSGRVEDEQLKKLQELSGMDGGGGGGGGGGNASSLMDELSSFNHGGTAFDVGHAQPTDVAEDDFERLVKGKTGAPGASAGSGLMDGGWDTASPATRTTRTTRTPTPRQNVASPTASASAVTFSWSTPSSTPAPASASASVPSLQAQKPPDLGGFAAMTPSSTQFSQALPARPMHQSPPAANPWASSAAPTAQRTPSSTAFSLPPPPGAGTASSASTFSLAPPPGSMAMGSMAMNASPTPTAFAPNYSRSALGGTGTSMNAMSMGMGMGMNMNMGMNSNGTMPPGMNMGMGMSAMTPSNSSSNGNGMTTQPGKTGLDKYESLL